MLKYGSNNIGKIYFGSNSIGKAYYGSDLVYQKGSSPTPPEPTNYISYIRGGTNDSYIDTGIKPDNTTKVVIWARNWNPCGGFLFGSRISYTSNTFGLASTVEKDTGRVRIDYAQSNSTFADDQFNCLSGYHKYELYDGVFKVDDITQASATKGTFSNEHNIHIFGLNDNGTHTNASLPIDICSCKIYKNDLLVRDFTAVNSPSVGLYDSISQTLFTSSGQGEFTFGSFVPEAYTPLQYIECTAQQYIDTLARVSYSDVVVSKFYATGTTPRYYMLFSAPDGGDGVNKTAFKGYLGNMTDLYRRFYVEYAKVAWDSPITATSLYNSTNPNLKGTEIIFYKNNNTARLYKNNAAIGSQGTFSSITSDIVIDNTTLIGAGSNQSLDEAFAGYIYYFGIGDKRALVPAIMNNVVGMYDNYNDVFYHSATNVPFVAGPTVEQ